MKINEIYTNDVVVKNISLKAYSWKKLFQKFRFVLLLSNRFSLDKSNR